VAHIQSTLMLHRYVGVASSEKMKSAAGLQSSLSTVTSPSVCSEQQQHTHTLCATQDTYMLTASHVMITILL